MAGDLQSRVAYGPQHMVWPQQLLFQQGIRSWWPMVEKRSAFKAFPASLSLQPGFLAPKFLGTNRASPKHAIIAFFDLHEAANTAIES